MKAKLLAIAALLVCAPAHADVVISEDIGGSFGPYLQKYLDAAYSHEPIRIMGECKSACTLFFGIVPRDQVCVGPNGTLGFHSASIGPGGPFTRPGTRFMWRSYPPEVHAMLRRRGWNGRTPHPTMMLLSHREMRELFRVCS